MVTLDVLLFPRLQRLGEGLHWKGGRKTERKREREKNEDSQQWSNDKIVHDLGWDVSIIHARSTSI